MKLLHIDTSHVCNLNCIYCSEGYRVGGYLYDEINKNKIQTKQQKDSSIFCDILKGREKFEGVIFSRGEPTLNKSLSRYIVFAKKNGYKKIEIVSNGIALSNINYVKKLLESGLTNITISFNTIDPRLNKILSGVDYDGKKTISAIYNLVKLGFKPHINIVLTKHSLISFKKDIIFLNKIGVNSISVSFLRYDGFNIIKEQKLDDRIEKNKISYTDFISLFKGFNTDILKNIKFNDIPICILLNSGIPQNLWGENKSMLFFDRKGNFRNMGTNLSPRVYLLPCKNCIMRKICCGIEKAYLKAFVKNKVLEEIYTIN